MEIGLSLRVELSTRRRAEGCERLEALARVQSHAWQPDGSPGHTRRPRADRLQAFRTSKRILAYGAKPGVDSDPRAPPADRARSVLTFRHGVVWGSFGPARVLGRPRQAVCSSRRSVQGLFRHGRSDGRFVPRALFGVRQGRRRARGASAGSRREIEDRSRILEIDMETIRRIFSEKYAGCFGNESFQHPDHIPVHQRRPACRNCVEIAWRLCTEPRDDGYSDGKNGDGGPAPITWSATVVPGSR